ncbi:MAG: DegQ family serine endoprotease [Rhodospirillaceae bacterium]
MLSTEEQKEVSQRVEAPQPPKRRRMSGMRLVVSSVAIIGVAAVSLGALRWDMLGLDGVAPVQAQVPVTENRIIVPEEGAPESFADLVEQLSPSVVNISTTQRMPDRGPQMPEIPPGTPLDEFFRDFFDRNGPGGGGEGRPRSGPRATSLGSGFIISEAGLIVTNNHVIEGADEITVILHDDTALKAELVGRDEKTDIAVLQVESDEPLPAVVMGDSESARVGDWVVAIGNPFGLGGTVTAGIISAKTRDINAGPYDSFIQTDASINKGNSGGPLFNMQGEVIGINTAIYSPSGGSIGIGFSVPTSLAKQVIADLTEFGRTRRGWIGVRIQTVTEDIAEGIGLSEASGALVAVVTPGGPSEAAGIKAGDVILRFDGKAVPDMRSLPLIVAETDIDKDTDIVVWRDGEEVNLTIKVGELEVAEETGLLDGSGSTPSPTENSRNGTLVESLGVTVAPISSELRERFDLADDAEGLVVLDVVQGSGAEEKGLQSGSVIVSANQTPMSSPSDLASVAEDARDAGRKTVLVLVETEGTRTFVAIALAEE